MHRLIATAAVGAVAVVASAVAVPSVGAPLREATQPDARIEVHDNFFDPRSVSINRGDTVRWVWKGINRHNVVFKRISSGAVVKRRIKTRAQGQVSRTFDAPGMYRYQCRIYDGMEGTIKVAPQDRSRAVGAQR